MNESMGFQCPPEDQIIKALAVVYDAPRSAVISWLHVLAQNFDSKAAYERLAESEARSAKAASGLFADARSDETETSASCPTGNSRHEH